MILEAVLPYFPLFSMWQAGEVLRFCAKYKTKSEAMKNITQVSMSGNFAIPGDNGFPLAGFFASPKDRAEGGELLVCLFVFPV